MIDDASDARGRARADATRALAIRAVDTPRGAAGERQPGVSSAMDLSFMDQSVEVAPAPAAPEPEPEPEQLGGGGSEPAAVDVDIGRGSFQQHDLSATTLLLESSPSHVECVASSSENLDHTVYIFKVFTPDGRIWCVVLRHRSAPPSRLPIYLLLCYPGTGCRPGC